MTPAGYSKRPLREKIGVKPGMRMHLRDAPDAFLEDLGALSDVERATRLQGTFDYVHWFVKDRATLDRDIGRVRKAIRDDGMLWVSWPKKASGVATDVLEDAVRAAGLRAGIVDVKVAAMDDVWSGLKFVVRLKDRA